MRSLLRRSAWRWATDFVDLQNFERLFLRDVIVHADHDFFFLVERDLIAIGGFGDFALRVAALDRGDHAAEGVDLFDVVPGAALDFVGQRFDEVGAAERIDGVGDAGFVGDDLLGAQRDRRREFGRQRPGFVERIGVQRLRSAENGGERLQRGAHDVVVGLLRGERAAGRLRVESQRPGARIFRAVALDHRFVPDAASGAVLGDFFEKVAVRVEEERKLRHEFVDVEAAAHAPLDVFEAIAQA